MSEEKRNAVVERSVGQGIGVSAEAGGLTFTNMAEIVEFAKLMAKSGVAIPKHLRDNPGACLAVVMQAVEWRLSPFQVAGKSYSVNDRLAFESQLIQAVILARAPIRGRFRVEYHGEDQNRTCTVSASLNDGSGCEVVYTSPPVGKITVKNSPLWKSEPDQQLFYYAARAMCRRFFPDILLGIYTEDELPRTPEPEAVRINPLEDDIEADFAVVAETENEQVAGQA